MKFNIKIIISTLFCIIFCLFAQEKEKQRILEIKRSSVHYFGDGVHHDAKIARLKAIESFVNHIDSTFQKRFWFTESESEEEFYQRAQVIKKAYSLMKLKDLKEIDYDTRKGKYIFKYIKRERIEEYIAEQKKKILGFLTSAWDYESEWKLGKAFRAYYRGFILSHIFPDTLHFPYPKIDSIYGIPQKDICLKLAQLLIDIVVNRYKIEEEGGETIITLAVYYQYRRVKELDVFYKTRDGIEYSGVKDGMALVTLMQETIDPGFTLNLDIEYSYLDNIKDKEVKWIVEKVLDADSTALLKFPANKRIKMDPSSPTFANIDQRPSPAADTLQTAGDLPGVIQDLMIINESRNLLNNLSYYHQTSKIVFGKKSDFTNPGQKYVFIVDRKDVFAALYFDGENYFDLNLLQTYPNLLKFAGKTMIWVEVL